ncbi:hypothetical protein Tco_0962402 [Tanacetum coccineum]
MTTKYCPRNEIKKIEAELWNLKVKGIDVVAYNQRFQELALLCDRMFPEETDKIERYVGGMPDLIYSSVVASKPKTMHEAIEMATELMDRRIDNGYHQKDRKPSQNDKTEHGMEKTVQNQGQSPKMPKSESILKNTIECNLNPSDGPGKPNSIFMKTVKTKWALNHLQQPICVQLTKTVKTLKAQS